MQIAGFGTMVSDIKSNRDIAPLENDSFLVLSNEHINDFDFICFIKKKYPDVKIVALPSTSDIG